MGDDERENTHRNEDLGFDNTRNAAGAAPVTLEPTVGVQEDAERGAAEEEIPADYVYDTVNGGDRDLPGPQQVERRSRDI